MLLKSKQGPRQPNYTEEPDPSTEETDPATDGSGSSVAGSVSSRNRAIQHYLVSTGFAGTLGNIGLFWPKAGLLLAKKPAFSITLVPGIPGNTGNTGIREYREK